MTAAQPPAGEPDVTAILLDLLKRAAEAHGIHETNDLGGVYDKQWPQWYAQHMTRTLAEAGYTISRAKT
jgi:hypothetical protein